MLTRECSIHSYITSIEGANEKRTSLSKVDCRHHFVQSEWTGGAEHVQRTPVDDLHLYSPSAPLHSIVPQPHSGSCLTYHCSTQRLKSQYTCSCSLLSLPHLQHPFSSCFLPSHFPPIQQSTPSLISLPNVEHIAGIERLSSAHPTSLYLCPTTPRSRQNSKSAYSICLCISPLL